MEVIIKLNEALLPSNQKFGYFFTFVFFVVSLYFIFYKSWNIAYIFGALSIVTLSATVLFPRSLSFFNKMWFRLGMVLNFIVSPIVLGIIFFLMISPISIVTNVFGRDELRIKKRGSKSFWIYTDGKSIADKSFRDQF